MALKTSYKFQIHMDDDLRYALRELALRKRISMSTLVYDVLKNTVQEENAKAAHGKNEERYE